MVDVAFDHPVCPPIDVVISTEGTDYEYERTPRISPTKISGNTWLKPISMGSKRLSLQNDGPGDWILDECRRVVKDRVRNNQHPQTQEPECSQREKQIQCQTLDTSWKDKEKNKNGKAKLSKVPLLPPAYFSNRAVPLFRKNEYERIKYELNMFQNSQREPILYTPWKIEEKKKPFEDLTIKKLPLNIPSQYPDLRFLKPTVATEFMNIFLNDPNFGGFTSTGVISAAYNAYLKSLPYTGRNLQDNSPADTKFPGFDKDSFSSASSKKINCTPRSPYVSFEPGDKSYIYLGEEFSFDENQPAWSLYIPGDNYQDGEFKWSKITSQDTAFKPTMEAGGVKWNEIGAQEESMKTIITQKLIEPTGQKNDKLNPRNIIRGPVYGRSFTGFVKQPPRDLSLSINNTGQIGLGKSSTLKYNGQLAKGTGTLLNISKDQIKTDPTHLSVHGAPVLQINANRQHTIQRVPSCNVNNGKCPLLLSTHFRHSRNEIRRHRLSKNIHSESHSA